jgi:hypothetical protein
VEIVSAVAAPQRQLRHLENANLNRENAAYRKRLSPPRTAHSNSMMLIRESTSSRRMAPDMPFPSMPPHPELEGLALTIHAGDNLKG